MFQFLPESARYLVAAGRQKEAYAMLKKAAEMNKNTLPAGTLVKTQVVGRCMHIGTLPFEN